MKPPTLEEVQYYCMARKNRIDPEAFIDYYTSVGWMVGKKAMVDWQAAVRTWERSRKGSAEQQFIDQHTARDWAN